MGAELRKRAEDHCDKGIPEEAHLLELEWCTREIIVIYVQYEEYREKRCHIEENRGQGVIKDRQK